MATYIPSDYTINQVTIGGLPFALLNISFPASVAIGDVLEFSNTLGIEINNAFLSAGILSVFGVECADLSKWNNMEYANTAISAVSLSLTDTVMLVENSNRAFRRNYRLTKNDVQLCNIAPQQGASGDAMSGCYGVILRVNNQYCGYSGTLGSVYDRYGAQYTNPFGNTTKDGVLIGLPSPEKLYTATQRVTITAVNLDMSSDVVIKSGDPYTDGGESDTGGGNGNFDGTSVDVDFTSLPTLSAVDTGFISLYNPTLPQLQSLANYMWSDLFDLDTFKKLFGDPMQAILGLSIVPGPVYSSGAQVVKVGNISTGINMNKAASQYIDIDCGTLNVEEFWGAYLDYEPYTKAEIYLPYIGTHQIAVDDIMGKAVHIKYHIDILSGACAAEIKCGGSVLYTFIGSVAVSIPVTGNDWTNVINGVLSIAGAVGSMVATGGASAPAAVGEIASAAVNSLKPNIEKSGSVSGGGGLMAGKVPVLILTRPRQALPASQNEYTGYPAFITRSLGAVSGYTEVHKIRLGGISATDAELDEIENLLKGGVIL